MNKLTLREYFRAFKVETSLKITLAGVICILINNIFHFDKGYLSTLFVFLILVLFHGEALKVGSQALLGCVISGSVTLIITYLFVDSKVLYLLLTGLWLFFCITFVQRFFLPTLLSGIVATLTIYESIFSSVSDATSLVGGYILQLVIAVIVCWIIDGLVWPHRSRGSFQLTLRTVYEEFSELFSSYTKERLVDRKDHHSISTSLITFSNLVTYINRMESEERNRDFPTDLYLKIITFSRAIFIKTEVLEEFVLKEHSFLSDELVKQNVNQIFNIISEIFSILAQSIGTKNVVNIEDKDIEGSISSLHELYRKMHEAEGMESDYYEDLLAFGAMLPVLDDLSTNIKRISEAINIFHKNEYQKILQDRVTRTKEVEKIKAGSFFSINKETSKAGIKTVAIFMLLIFAEFAIGLPGESQVAFYAILFGVVPNLGQAYMKSKYGILGVFSGLIFGFISLILVSQVPHFLMFLFLYCLGTFAAAYVASSSKDISVAGLQAGLIIPYALLYSTGYEVDLDTAFTRCMALLSTVLIAAIVHLLLWPVNPYKVLKQKISKAIAISGQILSKLLVQDIKEKEKVEKLVLPLAAILPTSTSLLHDAEYVIRQDDLHAEGFIHIIESIERIYADIETLKRTIYENIDSELIYLYLSHMEPLYEKTCRAFDEVSNQFNSGNDIAAEIASIIEGIQTHRAEFRDTGVWREFQSKDVEQEVLIATSIDSLLESLSKISLAVGEINQAKLAAKSILVTKEV